MNHINQPKTSPLQTEWTFKLEDSFRRAAKCIKIYNSKLNLWGSVLTIMKEMLEKASVIKIK